MAIFFVYNKKDKKIQIEHTMPNFLNVARPSHLDVDAFLTHYGDIFEHSSWVAEIAWKQGLIDKHDNPDALAESMGAVLQNADIDQQLAVIRTHPDLAGKAAMAGELTQDSSHEQAGAGLDQCTTAEFERFQRLNQTYKDTFTAIHQIIQIARFRLQMRAVESA